MNSTSMKTAIAAAFLAVASLAPLAFAQERAAAPGRDTAPGQPARARMGGGMGGPMVVSPEVQSDRRITFRILAPKAESVRLTGSDIPGVTGGKEMSKGTNGVWEITLGPVDPGAYRYNFNVDGVAVIDPRSPAISESNNNVWSLVNVAGTDFMDTRRVPHGAVASASYYSTSLGKFRRMHIYTPPGYEHGAEKYPVFYLLHGAGDSDDSWTSVGRAGFILDNLIADKKAKPMIVAMPAGHTRATMFGGRGGAGSDRPPRDEFIEDFLTDILPYVEHHYRVIADQAHRAIAGLSMGGSQSLNIAIPNLDKFGYVGVFSSGILGGPGRGRGATTEVAPSAMARTPWEEQHLDALDNPESKKGLKLFWFKTGKDDFLINNTRSTVAMFKKHGFNPVFEESTGGHTWINWRNYLNEFAPQLF